MARSLIPFGYGASDPLFSLHREMNRLFDDVLRGGPPAAAGQGQAASIFNASMNVSETDRELRVTVELPGVTQQDIDISLNDDVLTVSGEKKSETERGGEKEDFHFVERAYGRFQRSLRLPFSANPDEVRAGFENGVLTITVPKSAQIEKSRKIQIQGARGQESTPEQPGEGRPITERQPPRDQPGATH
jgi:HSP20 family protein